MNKAKASKEFIRVFKVIVENMRENAKKISNRTQWHNEAYPGFINYGPSADATDGIASAIEDAIGLKTTDPLRLYNIREHRKMTKRAAVAK